MVYHGIIYQYILCFFPSADESGLVLSHAKLSHIWLIVRQSGSANTIYTIWLFNIAMENGPFIDGLPIKNGDFPWLC
jgi:hypothetical protein